jgi:hypothetical protein
MIEYYWIAINGASCARASMPMRKFPKVSPTPQQIIGFPTLEEAQYAQHVCLTASMKEMRRFLESLSRDIKAGRIACHTFRNPEAPTRDATTWLETPGPTLPSAELH